MFGLSKDERLESLLKDKDVSLVGPAPYLIDQNRGKEFDESDIVVRPNEIIPLKHLRKDYGSRTDIYVCNFGTPWMDGIKRKIMTDDHRNILRILRWSSEVLSRAHTVTIFLLPIMLVPYHKIFKV